jgi:hypothetical protein
MPGAEQPPDDDPMVRAFKEIAETLKNEPAFADRGNDTDQQTSEEILARCDTIYLQLRGDHAPLPIARTPEELQAAIELRCKTGLARMAQADYGRPIDYAGYILIPYRYPGQRLEYVNPEAAQRLRKSYGIDTDSPDYHRQDYWMKLHDCFDIRALSNQYPQVWGTGTHPQDEFAQKGFVLGPIIRLAEEDPDDPDIDEYHQYAHMQFDPNNALLIPGNVLLDMLHQHYPHLLDGSGLHNNLPHIYLSEQFGLEPLREAFRHRWLAIRSAWEANHHEREGEE